MTASDKHLCHGLGMGFRSLHVEIWECLVCKLLFRALLYTPVLVGLLKFIGLYFFACLFPHDFP